MKSLYPPEKPDFSDFSDYSPSEPALQAASEPSQFLPEREVFQTAIKASEPALQAASEPSQFGDRGNSQETDYFPTDNKKKRVDGWATANNYPQARLSDGYVIPAGAISWQGFLTWQDHHLERAYKDVCEGLIVVAQPGHFL